MYFLKRADNFQLFNRPAQGHAFGQASNLAGVAHDKE
jgi:hypothetical protein